VDVSQAADELYGLPPQEFTARRDALTKEARATGDRAAATEMAALRKPTVVAWLANQLSRRHPEAIAPLFELGDALREATATLAGSDLRRLSSERQRLVHSLVELARTLGQDEGQRITEDVARGVEETLHAALADHGAAQQLVEARLTTALAHHGYDVASGDPSATRTSARPEPSRTRGPAEADREPAESRRRAERRSRLERDLGESWALARQAADARDEAITAADRAQRARADSEREVTRLQGELADAEAELETAVRADDRARSKRESADRTAQQTRQRVTELQLRLDGP